MPIFSGGGPCLFPIYFHNIGLGSFRKYNVGIRVIILWKILVGGVEISIQIFEREMSAREITPNSGVTCCQFEMGVSKNSGTPKSSILIGFSITNHPFWGTTIFRNTQIGSDMIFFHERNCITFLLTQKFQPFGTSGQIIATYLRRLVTLNGGEK